ncbi:MAG TPA: Gfo/Idh/MocA family oxidoreductase [Fibrobacteria bacterium]|nr:Gfo/Idh/MocA family oxidoreductase [Fibrobacteria bacterium]
MPIRKKTSAAAATVKPSKKVRYAVVGLGYFSQSSILPAFAHAGKNSELTALVSDDPEKLKKLGKKFKAKGAYGYDQYQDLLAGGEVDAVYIALPNDMHKDYAVRASKMGIHVLVEKPMAVTERECEEMIRAANEHHARLMVAYRLHLDAANLTAVETIKAGKIGDPRFFNSAFSMQVKDENIRVKAERGGGPVPDLGIYCINASRYLFRDEPYEAVAVSSRKKDDPRFKEVEEMTSAVLRFPGDRQAAFTCSFGAADMAYYNVVGAKGNVCLDQAYDVAFASTLETTVAGKTRTRTFPKKDQVAAELIYFSDCVLNGREPEPSGLEGLADVRIINAILESARTGKPVTIERVEKRTRPSIGMEIDRPPAGKPELFHAESPTRD